MSPTCQNMWETKPDNSNPEEIISNSLWLKECLMFVSSVPPPSGRRRSLNSEEMAVFYKNFLDQNRIRHANYNKWVVLQLGVSHGAAGCISSRSCGLELTLSCSATNKHRRLWRAFCELALKSGWKSGSDIFCPHTSPLWLLYFFWVGFKL